MIASYHNHTTWSDGTATVSETLAAAREQGIDELGISDHWVLDPRGETPRWSMPPARLGDYVAEVRAARPGTNPTLRLGLEVDWFPDHAAAIAARLAEYDFDYLIGSVHTIDGFRADSYVGNWEALEVEERDAKHRRYWALIADLARSGLFDVVGHLDLTKKFNQHPTIDLSQEMDTTLDAIAEADMAVELNTSGWFKPCADAYPSVPLLRACRSRDIPVLITADAHETDHLRLAFDRGAARLREVGYEAVAIFRNRQRSSAPLPLP